jgi:ribonuclease HI
MIKSVLQAIPAYIMNIYLLPDTLINDIERMINAFWWGGGSDNRGIRWLAWDKLARPKEEGGLGFRDFHNFNMAMVAKQGWNFMHHPTSLVARLYKARYFPKTSFLDSNIGNNPSFAWRSIWRARHVLLLGCRWQIGDGSKISVMNEPWLRENQGRFLNAPQTQEVYSFKVQHLLLPNVKRWDEDKIHSIFSREVAREILAVPLLDLVREDKLIWNEENNGVYSVRTGYRILMKDKNKGYGSREVGGWSCIWKIHAPPKTKHLLWRICRECLPTRSRLRNRYVQCPDECPLCTSHVEEDFHVFVSCDGVREAWHVMELSNFIQPWLHSNNNMRDFIFHICRNGSELEASRAAVLLWFIWNNRNNMVWNDTGLSPQQIGAQAFVYWQQWAMINGILTEQQQPAGQVGAASSSVQWIQPPVGFFKCNVDASFYNTAGATGCGWVLRDCRGQFQLAGSNIKMASLSILEGEAWALIEAMEEMIHRGLSFVIFESDSKLVVDAISSRQVGVSDFSILISHIKTLLRFNNYFEVKYVKRQANKVAHSLARAAFSMSRRCVFDSVPPCIDSLLSNEIC